ncbi:MAG: DUF3152 domain-containing protein [Corynebacteriales bacterium]|nr:DUF3152 domain-containing protein [Mycobacteriales bacterium]
MDSTQETRIARRARRRRMRQRRAITLLILVTAVATGLGFTWYYSLSSAQAKTSNEHTPPQPGSESPPVDHAATPLATPSVTPPAQPVEQGAGTFTTVSGTGQRSGAANAQLYTYQVQIEDGIEQDGAAFAAEVEATLGDNRSWISQGDVAFQRVDTANPSFVLYLASPKTVDALCAPMDTAGYTSCRTGDKVVINLARWMLAVPDYGDSLTEYRQYVINHEVGHRLGHGHDYCPGAGQPAPVMQQQTYGLQGCTINPWPFP